MTIEISIILTTFLFALSVFHFCLYTLIIQSVARYACYFNMAYGVINVSFCN